MRTDSWLADFAARVRDRDLEGGRLMFDPACVSFGTRTDVANSLDELIEDQWTPVWAATTGFHFIDSHVVSAGLEATAVAVRWTSIATIDGRTRTGRATIVLRADADATHGCLCVHTHFSTTPLREAL